MTNTPKSWRDVLPVHPAAALFDPLDADEFRTLTEDIKKNGLIVPPVLWEAAKGEQLFLLDGRNRLNAMEAAGLPVLDKEGRWLDTRLDFQCIRVRGEDPYELVITLNIHRRHLTTEKRIELVEKIIKASPEMSARRASKLAGVSPTTAVKARRKLQQRGDVSTVDTSIDTKGRAQPATKKPRATARKPQRDADQYAADIKARKTAKAEQPQQIDLEELTPPTEQLPSVVAVMRALDQLEGDVRKAAPVAVIAIWDALPEMAKRLVDIRTKTVALMTGEATAERDCQGEAAS